MKKMRHPAVFSFFTPPELLVTKHFHLAKENNKPTSSLCSELPAAKPLPPGKNEI